MLAGPLTTSELLTRAAAEDVDRPAHYLLAAAALNRLVSGELVMAGRAAEFIHTGTVSDDPIALLGRLSLRDGSRLARSGFANEGDVLVHRRGRSVLAFTLAPVTDDFLKPPMRFDIAGVAVPVLSTTDLVLQRLVEVIDGTPADWEAVGHLVVSTRLTVDWPRMHERAVTMATMPGLADLPSRVETFAALTR